MFIPIDNSNSYAPSTSQRPYLGENIGFYLTGSNPLLIFSQITWHNLEYHAMSYLQNKKQWSERQQLHWYNIDTLIYSLIQITRGSFLLFLRAIHNTEVLRHDKTIVSSWSQFFVFTGEWAGPWFRQAVTKQKLQNVVRTFMKSSFCFPIIIVWYVRFTLRPHTGSQPT